MKNLVFIEEEYNSELLHHAEKINGVVFRDIYIKVVYIELTIIR